MTTNLTMEQDSLLSEDEVQLRALLMGVKDTTLWGWAIRLVLEEGSTAKFRQLVEQLRDQAKDNPDAMKGIIGEGAMAALKGLNLLTAG